MGRKQKVGAGLIHTSALSHPLVLLVVLSLVRGLIYLSVFPPFLAPDEAAHFEAIRMIGQEQKWPTDESYLETPMHPEMDATFERFRIWNLVGLYSPVKNLGITDGLFIHYYPQQIAGSEIKADSYLVAYHLGLAPLSAALTPLDLVTQVYLLRLVSVILATVTIVTAWYTVRAVFPQSKLIALGVCTFLVFWPMHTHVAASINSDVLAELIGTLFFLMLVNTWRLGFSPYRTAALLGVLGVGLLVKPTVFFLLPTLVAALIIRLGRRLKWRTAVIGLWVGVLVVVTWIGALFLHENSDGGRRLLSFFSTELRLPQWSQYFTPEALVHYVQSFNFAVVSFAGLFGWSNIHVPWMLVRVWAGFLLIIFFGGLIFAWQHLLPNSRSQSSLTSYQQEILVIFLLAIVFCLISITTPVIVTRSTVWAIHARYYFPAIIPIAFYLFLSVRQLIPTEFRRFLWPGWLLGWAAYDAAVFVLIILPFLYS